MKGKGKGPGKTDKSGGKGDKSVASKITKVDFTKSPKVATHTKSGTKFCDAFQKDKCPHKGASCDNGKHACAGIMKGAKGNICSLSSHGAASCRRCIRL